MEEETTTRYELTDRDQEIRNKMLELIDKPKFVQTYMYHADKINKIYQARVIVDKPDRISVIDKSFSLRIGTHGLFIKQGVHNSGVTYHKKGRSSARLRYWGTKQGGYMNQHDTMIGLAKEVNPDCVDILNKDVIRQIGTQGMFGSIIAGKTDTLTKAMEYYIRYSLRGVGIDMKHAMNLYHFIKKSEYGFFSSIKGLRVAKDPNGVLKLVSADFDNPRLTEIIRDSQEITELALMVSEKIDWVNPTFNIYKEKARLVKKKHDIGKQLSMWNGGPILKDTTPKPKATNDMVLTSLGKALPF